jgi:hypothetical protein
MLRFNEETGELYDDGISVDDSTITDGYGMGDTSTASSWSEADWNNLLYGSPTGTTATGDGTTNDSSGWSSNATGGSGSFDIGKFLSGLSGAGIGLTTTGVLGALAALTGKPSSTTFTSSQSGTTGGTSSGTQTQKAELPKWYMDLIEEQATNLPTKGYEQFGKDFLNMPNNRKVADYMNPYIEQVMNPGLRRQAEDQALQRQKFDAERVSRGAFGSGRTDLLANQMAERQGLARQEFIDRSYKDAFTNASGLAQTDINRAFEDWKLLQAGGTGTIGAAGQTANVLNILKPPQTTTSTSTGTSTGTTTSGTAATNTGPDPNKLASLANIAGTITASAYPQGLPK